MNEQVNHMSDQERAIRDIMHNCLLVQGEERLEQTVANVLAELGKHYRADRAGIFEANEAGIQIADGYEWRGEGVASKMEDRRMR